MKRNVSTAYLHLRAALPLQRIALCLALVGCADTHENVREVRSGLVRANSCQELETALQEDAVAKIELEADRYYEILDRYGLDYRGEVSDDGIAPPATVDAGVGQDENGGTPSSDGATGGKREYSETNKQVAGVDEADFVKTDGTRIYVASGNQLHVLNAWPAASTALERTIDLEGQASELFVADNKVVVFETVAGSAELGGINYCDRASKEPVNVDGGDEPDPRPEPTDAGVPEPDPAMDGGEAPVDPAPETDAGVDGGEAPVDPDAGVDPEPAPDEPRKDVDGPSDAYCYSTFTKISVIDLSGEPSYESETYYEGAYLSSRRHGEAVRAVINSAVTVPLGVRSIEQYAYQVGLNEPATVEEAREFIAAWSAASIDAARNTTLEDWLPARAQKVDGQLQKLAPACADFYLPSPGLTEYGLTQIAGVSLADGSLGGAAILGRAEQVYANEAALVLAQNDWSWGLREAEGSQTVVHVFELGAGLDTRYQGSGFAPGNLLNQFSIHEKAGTYFLATTQDLWGGWPVAEGRPAGDPGDTVEVDAGTANPPPTDADGGSSEGSSGGGSSGGDADAGSSGSGSTPAPEDAGIGSSENPLDGPEPPYNYVTALELRDGQLEIVGQSPILAPGERIFSARYVGDRAYVVTFRQVDPLFALDISDPTDIRLLGELKIPGFSNYMHPLDDDHLLTIGREVDPVTNADEGLALQIFDVSDATAPALAHKHVFAKQGWSEANWNHKAFTYYAAKNILAFPYVSYEGAFESSLELFDVDVTAGLSPLGSISHTDQAATACGWDSVEPAPADIVGSCSVSPEIRRGLFIEDYVYAISWSGVTAHALTDLQTPQAEVTW